MPHFTCSLLRVGKPEAFHCRYLFVRNVHIWCLMVRLWIVGITIDTDLRKDQSTCENRPIKQSLECKFRYWPWIFCIWSDFWKHMGRVTKTPVCLKYIYTYIRQVYNKRSILEYSVNQIKSLRDIPGCSLAVNISCLQQIVFFFFKNGCSFDPLHTEKRLSGVKLWEKSLLSH